MQKKSHATKRFFCAMLAIITAAACLPVTAIAAENTASSELPALWADGNPSLESSDQHAIDAVKWFAYSDMSKEITNVGKTKSTEYYLFMPSTADLNALTLWHTFDSDPTINGVSVKSGETTTAISGEGKYTMSVDGSDYMLTVMQSQSIGAIYIDTETGTMKKVHENKQNKEAGNILVVEADGKADYQGELSYIKGRGNTTWKHLLKKPYNIKLDKKASLLGMDQSKKWCLLANAQDHSMLRNKIAYDLGDELGLPYSPDSGFANLYLNGEYAGVYQLSEKVEEGKNNLVKINDLTSATEKINDKELDSYQQVKPQSEKGTKKYYDIPNDPDDITGGYLIEYAVTDKYDTEPSGFITNRGQCVVVKGPENASKAQIDYISSFVQEMEDAIYSMNGKNSKGKYYTEYIDIESAALMYLVQEYSLNIDGGTSSCFFYKDSDKNGDGKIHAAPVWDFDVAFGNLDNEFGYDQRLNDPDALYVCQHYNWEIDDLCIFAELYTHRDFVEKVIELYNERFKPALEILNSSEKVTGEHLKSIPQYRSELESGAAMNFIRWRIKDSKLVSESGKNFNEQIEYLSKFTSERAAFFEKHFNDRTVSDELVVYFDNTYSEFDKVYLYFYDGITEPEWPGIEMKPLEYKGFESVYKLDLGALGMKDDGFSRVIINNGGSKKTTDLIAKNKMIVYYNSYSYTDDNGEEVTSEYTDYYFFYEEGIKEESYILGDVDGDGNVTASDALRILRLSVGADKLQNNDVYASFFIDGDNEITSADALYALRYSVTIKDDILNRDGNAVGELVTYYEYYGYPGDDQ